MNDGHPSGEQSTTPSNTPPINNGQQPVVSSSQQSNSVQAQSFVGPQAVQPQMIQPQASASMQFQPQLVSSDTGDIVLGGSEPKKRLIVGVVIAILVLVCVGMGSVFLVNRSDNSSFKNQDELRVSSFDAYKRYANFLVYGLEDDALITDDVLWNSQSILHDISDSFDMDKRVQYADKISDLYNDFNESFSALDLSAENEEYDGLILSLFESNSSSVQSLVDYLKAEVITSNDIAREYLISGESGVIEKINSNYPLNEGRSDAYSRFVEAKLLEAELISDVYDYYSDVGCITDQMLIEGCVNLHKDEDIFVQLISLANDAVENSEMLERHLSIDLISTSSELYSILEELQ